MKRRIWAIVLVIVMAVASLGAAASPDSEEALMVRLKGLSMEGMIKETEKVSEEAGEPEALIFHASALAYRLDELTEEQILSYAADREKPEYFRVIMLELCGKLKEDGKLKDTAVLEELFADTSEIEAVRIRAGYLIENPKLLEAVFWQDGGNVAFQALKALRFADPDRAWTVAGDILDNYEKEPMLKVKAAVKAKAAILARHAEYSKEKAAFIEECARLRESLAKDDPDLRLTFAFALTELKDMDALALVLEDGELMANIHSFAVHENMVLLEETLKAGASQKDLEIAVAAAYTYPEEDERLHSLVANAVEEAPFYSQSERDAILGGVTTPIARADLGYISYAVYRNGVLGDFTWHAALMDVAYKTSSGDVVIQAKNNYSVDYGTWAEFLTGQGTGTYMGTYRPDSTMSSLARGNVNARATYLVNDNIPYNITQQMVVTSNLSTGDKIAAGDILTMRCDGVIEYCYEYYGFRVYGNNTYWDISTYSINAIEHHSYNLINPETQAQNYLTQVLNQYNEPVQ